MNHKLEKKMRRALKAPVPVSEEHLEATKELSLIHISEPTRPY